MKTAPIFIVLFLAFVSCSDFQKSGHLASIDAMSKGLDSLKTQLTENKLDSAKEFSLEAIENERRVKNFYVADTIDMVFADKMTRYKNMRRAFNSMPKSYNNLQLGFNEVSESLRQLRHDIDNGNGDRGKYAEYIAFEQSKYNQLKAMTDDYIQTKEKNYATYLELNDEIHDFSILQQEKNTR